MRELNEHKINPGNDTLTITVLDEQFRQEPGKTLADLLRKVEGEMEGRAVEGAAAPGPQ